MHNDLRKATEVLKTGGVILYPADIGWGLGCDGTNQSAVEKVHKIKQQNSSFDKVVLFENPALLERYVPDVPEIAWDLAEISITPLTIIFPGTKNLAVNLPEENGSLGTRITREEFTVKLLQRFRKPLVFSSAAIFQDEPPVSFHEISNDITDAVDYIVEYRQDDAYPAIKPGIIKLWPDGRIDIIRK